MPVSAAVMADSRGCSARFTRTMPQEHISSLDGEEQKQPRKMQDIGHYIR